MRERMYQALVFFIWATILCVWAQATHAAPPCWPNMNPPKALSITYVIESPAVNTAMGDVIFSASQVGLVWGYSCKDGTGKAWKVIAGGPWDQFPKEWLYLLDTALRGTEAQRQALWDKYSTASEWDARLKPDLDAVWAKLPVPAAYVVNGTGSRPTYAVRYGALATPANGTVQAGSPCDCSVSVGKDPYRYCSVNGRPDQLAQCKAAQ